MAGLDSIVLRGNLEKVGSSLSLPDHRSVRSCNKPDRIKVKFVKLRITFGSMPSVLLKKSRICTMRGLYSLTVAGASSALSV